MTRRREFIGLLAAIVALALRPARAQTAAKAWRVGWIGTAPPASSPESERIWSAFIDALRALGYVEGRNLAFEMRYTEGKAERFPTYAADLVQLKVDAIVVAPDAGARAVKEATAQIPVVMWQVTDVVGLGLVASLARPGGNLTGVSAGSFAEQHNKRLELLKAIAPNVRRVAWLQGDFHGLSATQAAARRAELDAAEQKLGITQVRITLNSPKDFDSAAAAVVRERADALILSPNPPNYLLRREIAEFALKQRLPAVAGPREAAQAGLLASFSPSMAAMVRDVAVYLDKIFKGANPGDLPVVEASTFELVVNRRTAKTLGIAIPQSVLLRADEVID